MSRAHMASTTDLAPPAPKFRRGQIVIAKSTRYVAGGVFRITGLRPFDGREHQYSIRHLREAHERIAGEGQLSLRPED
jgi:hypothetical protein